MPHIHPFMQTFTHWRQSQPCKATASLSGACPFSGHCSFCPSKGHLDTHLDTQLGPPGEQTSNQGCRSLYADYAQRVGPQALGGAPKLRLTIQLHKLIDLFCIFASLWLHRLFSLPFPLYFPHIKCHFTFQLCLFNVSHLWLGWLAHPGSLCGSYTPLIGEYTLSQNLYTLTYTLSQNLYVGCQVSVCSALPTASSYLILCNGIAGGSPAILESRL